MRICRRDAHISVLLLAGADLPWVLGAAGVTGRAAKQRIVPALVADGGESLHAAS